MDNQVVFTKKMLLPMVWEEPPSEKMTGKRLPKDVHVNIAEVLKKNPGKWARLTAVGITFAASMMQGKYMAFRPVGEWEAVVRYNNIYIRYIGPKEDEQ